MNTMHANKAGKKSEKSTLYMCKKRTFVLIYSHLHLFFNMGIFSHTVGVGWDAIDFSLTKHVELCPPCPFVLQGGHNHPGINETHCFFSFSFWCQFLVFIDESWIILHCCTSFSVNFEHGMDALYFQSCWKQKLRIGMTIVRNNPIPTHSVY